MTFSDGKEKKRREEGRNQKTKDGNRRIKLKTEEESWKQKKKVGNKRINLATEEEISKRRL